MRQPKISVNQLGPRQQYTGKNGQRYKLVSKAEAFKEIANLQAAGKRGSPMPELTREIDRAVAIALRILDRPNADPDDDLSVLSRQLLRSDEHVAKLGAKLDASESQHQAELAATVEAAMNCVITVCRRIMGNRAPCRNCEPIITEIKYLTPASAKRALALEIAKARLEEAKLWGFNNHDYVETTCQLCKRHFELETQVRELGGTP